MRRDLPNVTVPGVYVELQPGKNTKNYFIFEKQTTCDMRPLSGQGVVYFCFFYYLAPLQNDYRLAPLQNDYRDITMRAVHFWGQERGLPVGQECPTYD